MAASSSQAAAQVHPELDPRRSVMDVDAPSPDALPLSIPVCEACGCGQTADLPPASEMCPNCFDRYYPVWAMNPETSQTLPEESVLAAAPTTPLPGSAEKSVLGAAAARSGPLSAEESALAAEGARSEWLSAKESVLTDAELNALRLSAATFAAAAAESEPGSAEETVSESRAGAEKVVVQQVSELDSSAALQQDLEGGDPLCVKCRYPVSDVFRAKVYGKRGAVPTLICRTCNNAYTMLAKRLDLGKLGEAGLELSAFTAKETESFYRQAAKLGDDGVSLSWSGLKTLLTETFTERRVSSRNIALAEKELPLSVWERKGFSTAEIVSRGKKCAHPVFGEVWSVPLKTTTHEEVILVCNS